VRDIRGVPHQHERRTLENLYCALYLAKLMLVSIVSVLFIGSDSLLCCFLYYILTSEQLICVVQYMNIQTH
jgi:hypothetical protein